MNNDLTHILDSEEGKKLLRDDESAAIYLDGLVSYFLVSGDLGPLKDGITYIEKARK